MCEQFECKISHIVKSNRINVHKEDMKTIHCRGVPINVSDFYFLTQKGGIITCHSEYIQPDEFME